jgi:hypothetical protein
MNFKHFILSGLALASFSASAVEVVGAKLDSTAENLIVTLRHGGGCGEHNYKLVLSGCAETMPVQCQATIKHSTADFCEAILTREATFNLKQYGLNTPYYKNAKFTVVGDDNSAATVTLVAKKPETTSAAKIRCMTHTGSILEISGKTVSLTTTSNESAEYGVVGTRVIVLESLPSIFQTTYKLDDGRSIQTSFRSGSTSGTGEFIRVDGSRSPDFTCVSK